MHLAFTDLLKFLNEQLPFLVFIIDIKSGLVRTSWKSKCQEPSSFCGTSGHSSPLPLYMAGETGESSNVH